MHIHPPNTNYILTFRRKLKHMTTTFLSHGYMRNRCCSSTFTPSTWTTFSNPQKRLSVTIRNVAQSKWSIQKIYDIHTINKRHIGSTKSGIAHRLHTYSNCRSSSWACNVTLDFWDVAIVSLAAVGLSIGFMKSYPYESHNLLSLGPSYNNDCVALHKVNGEGDVKADIEMTFHQPPSFNEHMKTISTMSTDSQATFSEKNVASTKPYDVSHLISKFLYSP